jgi:hypothetical protein
MRKWTVGVLALAALLFVLDAARAGADHAAVAKDMLATLGDVVKTLRGISDEATANAARPDLKKAGLKLDELRRKARALKQPTQEEKEKLERDFQPKFDEVLRDLRLESVRVKGLPGGAEAVKEIALPPEKKADGDKDKKK